MMENGNYGVNFISPRLLRWQLYNMWVLNKDMKANIDIIWRLFEMIEKREMDRILTTFEPPFLIQFNFLKIWKKSR